MGMFARPNCGCVLVASAIAATALMACGVSVGTVSGQEVKVSTSTTSVTAVAIPPGENEPTTTVPGPCRSGSVTVTEPGQVQGVCLRVGAVLVVQVPAVGREVWRGSYPAVIADRVLTEMSTGKVHGFLTSRFLALRPGTAQVTSWVVPACFYEYTPPCSVAFHQITLNVRVAEQQGAGAGHRQRRVGYRSENASVQALAR